MRHVALIAAFAVAIWLSAGPQYDGKDIVGLMIIVAATVIWMHYQRRAEQRRPRRKDTQ